EAHRESDMRNGDRPEASVKIERDEQQKQGQSGDNFGHHERRKDHARKQRAPREAAEPHQRDRGERAEGGCDRCRQKSDADRNPRGIFQALIFKQGSVPFRRPAAPHRNQLGLVEAVDHEQQDWDVEKRKAERDCRGVEPGEAGSHRPASRSFCCWRWNRTIGMTSTSSSTTATAEASGQSRLLKNSLHKVLPIISVCEPPNRSGMTNSPTAGMKTSRQPAMTPGNDSGKVIFQK